MSPVMSQVGRAVKKFGGGGIQPERLLPERRDSKLLRRGKTRAPYWSMQDCQNQQTGESGEDRDWNPIAGVVPKPDFNMAPSRFDHDNIGYRADNSEVPCEGCCQRHHFPHQLGLRKVVDPFPGD